MGARLEDTSQQLEDMMTSEDSIAPLLLDRKLGKCQAVCL